jgi:predicted DNA-binding transcriptional regulator YafY
MRRADRLFDIIQALRAAKRPVTAAALAAELEVTTRTIYRDVAALQAARVPVEGAAGIGYVLRRGYDLPPLMFTLDEVEAIVVGTRLVRRTRDPELQQAAERVLAKVTEILPETLRGNVETAPLFVWDGARRPPLSVDLAAIRRAIHATRKLRIDYVDEKGARTERTVWPIAIAYFVEATLIAAWCELRRDFRHFRADRIGSWAIIDETYPNERGALMTRWLASMRSPEQPEP